MSYLMFKTVPHYNFNIPLPVHLEKIKDKVGNKIHEDIVSTIIKLGDQMNMETNVKANMTNWFMHRENKSFDKLMQIVWDIINVTLNSESLPLKIVPAEVWGASYTEGQYTEMHAHYPKIWSWVYYVKVPEGSSPLVFDEANMRIEPKEGDLVIFPGWVMHSVPKCKCKEPRMVVSGNFDVVPSFIIKHYMKLLLSTDLKEIKNN